MKKKNRTRLNRGNKRPSSELTERIETPQWSQISTHPSENLTPERLASILKEAEAGDVYRQMELFEDIEEKDLHLSSQLATRKNAVLGLEYEVIAYSEDPKDVEIAKFIEQVFDNFDDWSDAQFNLLDAIGKGFACVEPTWAYLDGDFVPTNFNWVHQKHFFWDQDGNFRIRTKENPNGEAIPPYKLIMHKYKARSGSLTRAGVDRVVTWMYLFKNYTIKDWVSFSEVYGMPLRLGKYDDSTSTEDKRALMQAVMLLGSDGAGIIHQNTAIEFVDNVSKGTSVDIYERLANFCNKEMSKAILGQTLTSEVGSTGSYAASQTHDEVRQDIKEADCKALCQTIKRDLIKPLVLFNFGVEYERRIPTYKIKFEPPEDTKEKADTYKIVINEIGLPVSKQHLYETFSIPKPKAGEDLVVPITIQQAQVESSANQVQVAPNKSSTTVQDAPNLSEAIEAIDGLADQATLTALPLLKKAFEPMIQIIQNSGSYEEMKEQLADMYPQLVTDDLEELLSQSMFVADLAGRWSANE